MTQAKTASCEGALRGEETPGVWWVVRRGRIRLKMKPEVWTGAGSIRVVKYTSKSLNIISTDRIPLECLKLESLTVGFIFIKMMPLAMEVKEFKRPRSGAGN